MNHFIDPALAVRLVLTLLHSLWEGTAIVIAAAIGATLFGRSASGRYLVFFAALILIAVAAAATFVRLSPPDDTQPIVSATSVRQTLVVPIPAIDAPPIRPKMPAAPLITLHVSPITTQKPDKLRFDWEQYAAPTVEIYVAGVVLMLLRLSIAIRGGRKLRSIASPVTDSAILAALRRQAARLGLRLAPPVAFSGRVVVPTVLGIVRPMILLPVSVSTGLSIDVVEAILAHELAHIRRCDHLFQFVQRLVEAVFFCHPAV